MEVQEILAQARDAMTAKRVFGDPIERDGTTVVPVARIMGGSGFGSGTEAARSGEAAGEAAPPQTGSGAGFGLVAGPAGVYVIRGGQVTWQPAVSPERMVFVAGVVAFLVLFGVRSILKVLRGR
jgi:uncharacterized spore protein YtfJ